METEKLQKVLKNQHVLFDTNIFIKAYENFNAFSKILYLLKDCDCQIVHFPLVEFEFTRNSFMPKHRIERENFIKKIASLSLPFSSELIDNALKIAQIYAHKNIPNNQISLVDCCIAAYLMQHAGRLYLLTLNHKDFPVILLDDTECFE